VDCENAPTVVVSVLGLYQHQYLSLLKYSTSSVVSEETNATSAVNVMAVYVHVAPLSPDIEIPLEHGESMMFPRVEGRMLQELELDIEDECLEIGTGSGYVTACMAMMSRHVHSIDIYDDFLESAADKLAQQNIANIKLEHKDALQFIKDFDDGKKPARKYDAIAVTGSIPEYAPAFEQLLKPGGRLFVVVGATVGKTPLMHAMKVVRSADIAKSEFTRSSLFETELKPLVGLARKPSFSF